MQNTVEEIEAIQNLICEAQSGEQSLDVIEVTWQAFTLQNGEVIVKPNVKIIYS
jgi:hypothetical protein